MICTLVMAFVGGYTVFLPGQWDVPTFLFSYFMIGLFPILFFGWKLLKGAKWRRPEEVDLKGEVAEIDEPCFFPSSSAASNSVFLPCFGVGFWFATARFFAGGLVCAGESDRSRLRDT